MDRAIESIVECPFPVDETVSSLFEKQAATYPENVAVICNERTLTYRDLNEKSNRLAAVLRKAGVVGDSIVAIMVNPSIDMAVGIMAILKAGGAYLPIDPSYPRDRIDYLLSDSGARLLITESGIADEYTPHHECILIDAIDFSAEPTANLEQTITSRNLAYVIYTSGTTGRPKGVMVEHRGVVNTLYFRKNEYEITPDDTALEFFSFAFDGFVTIFFTPLISGAKVILLTKDEANDVEQVARIIVRHQVTNIISVPALYSALLESLTSEQMRSLKIVTLAGDVISEKLVKDSYRKSPTTEISVEYGVTEASVMSTVFRHQELDGKVKIGRQIPNTRIRLLDDALKPVPIGTPGELCIGGVGLARGYLNSLELTERKFIDDPYASGERLYRSGDLARCLPDGNLEFLGRSDNQVKIRGFRIETAEIENRLLDHSDLQSVLVMARDGEGGAKYLCAYYVSDAPIEHERLAAFVAERLPGHMVPAFFVRVPDFPLTPHGKIDRSALPAPALQLSQTRYVAPQTDLERLLTSVWEEVLGIPQGYQLEHGADAPPRIGLTDSFFHLGGDSIKAMQIASRVLARGYRLRVQDIMSKPTPQALIPHLTPARTQSSGVEVTGPAPLTPIQEWFFRRKFENMSHWNQAVIIRSQTWFDEQKLEAAIVKVIKRHDALRTVFVEEGGRIVQQVRPSADVRFSLDVYHYSSESEYAKNVNDDIRRVQQSFRLDSGLLIRAALLRTNEEDRLLIVAHHLVIDSVSFRIILEDVDRVYSALLSGQDYAFPSKSTSYLEWASRLATVASDRLTTSEIDYWRRLSQAPALRIAADHLIEKDTFRDNATATISLDRIATAPLLHSANRAFGTKASELLIAALALALRETAVPAGPEPHANVLLNLEGHGREELFDDVDVSRTVGWFTSSYPALFQLSENATTEHVITVVKDTLRDVPKNGLGYGVLAYLSDADTSRAVEARPEINFNYLGEIDLCIDQTAFELVNVDVASCIDVSAPRSFKLDLCAYVVDGRLSIDVHHNVKQFESATIELFCEALQRAISAVVGYCQSQDRVERTKSDFRLLRASNYEFDRIKAQLSEGGVWHQVEDIYPLSPMQEGMLYTGLQQSETNEYVEQLTLHLRGSVNVADIENAFNDLINRHAVLRTLFLWEGVAQPVQVVLTQRPISLRSYDVSEMSGARRQETIDALERGDRRSAFDLNRDPLLRVTLIKLDHDEFILLIGFHHIIMDGWCFALLFDDFINVIGKTKVRGVRDSSCVSWGDTADDRGDPPSYSEYIRWLTEYDRDGARRFWRDYLSGYTTPSLISRWSPAADDRNDVGEFVVTADSDLGGKVVAFARERGVTVNTVFQSAWAVLLWQHLMQNDVAFGYVVSGRPPELHHVESMMGLFINTIPLRVAVDPENSFARIAQTVHVDSIRAKAHEYLSLAEVQSANGIHRKLFDHILIFENFPAKQYINDPRMEDRTGFRIDAVDVVERTEYDLTVTITPQENAYDISFLFSEAVFSEEVVRILAGHYVDTLERLLIRPETPIGDATALVEFTHPAGVAQIDLDTDLAVQKANDTRKEYDRDVSVKTLIDRAVARYPNNIAVRCDGRALTYRELDRRSNRLAHRLVAGGAGPETIVALMLYPSIETVISILAVIKAGAAYLPIEPDLPPTRIEYMLEDSASPIILCSEATVAKCPRRDALDMIVSGRESLSDFSDEPLDRDPAPSDLAYIIYTSGTTGRPKGVQVEHRNLRAYIQSFCDYFTITSSDVFLQQASYAFDAFVEELYPSLINGATVAILPRDIAGDIERLRAYAEAFGVTMISASPLLLNELDKLPPLFALHTYISGGDVLRKEHIANLLKRGRVVNSYGPTETTVCCTYYECRPNDDTIPIGKPIANYQVFIMDPRQRVQPMLAPGEICIGGEGVTRGYLNNPELSREKYVPHPFRQGSTLYRSGDYGRYLPNGTIEFLGRLDAQVKVRGYRIEVGEIESRMRECEVVQDVVVVAREGTDREAYLCAYYTSSSPEVKLHEIREYLGLHLPAFMIPAYFIRLDRIPTTVVGKVDKTALPEPRLLLDAGEDYAEPETPTQELIVKAIRDTLELDRVGINDRFLSLGGDSLKAVRLVGRLKEHGINLPLSKLMSNAAIRDLAAQVQDVNRAPAAAAGCASSTNAVAAGCASSTNAAAAVDGHVRLHPYQMTVFKSASLEDVAHYNTAGLFLSPEHLDQTLVQRVLDKLVSHHDALRTRFDVDNDVIRQYVRRPDEYTSRARFVDLRGIAGDLDERLAAEMQAVNRNSTLDDLFRLTVMRTDRGDYLYFTVHHLITDAYSDHVIYDDFFRGYRQASENREIRFFAKTAAFRTWIDRLYDFSSSPTLLSQIDYWKRVVYEPASGIPRDYELLPGQDTFENVTDVVSELLDEAATSVLRQRAQRMGVSVSDILLASWSLTVYQTTGAERTRVFYASNGRSAFGEAIDISRTVGVFTINYPLLIELKDTYSPMRHLHNVANTKRNVPMQGCGYVVLKHVTDTSLKAGEQFCLPDGEKETLFNYLGELADNSIASDLATLGNVKAVPIPATLTRTKKAKWKRDLMMFIGIGDGKLTGFFQYSVCEYKRETIDRLVEVFRENITAYLAPEFFDVVAPPGSYSVMVD